MEDYKKDSYDELKKQQYVPIRMPEAAFFPDDHIAVAEGELAPHPKTPIAQVESHEFRLNMPPFSPDDEILETKKSNGDEGFYTKVTFVGAR